MCQVVKTQHKRQLPGIRTTLPGSRIKSRPYEPLPTSSRNIQAQAIRRAAKPRRVYLSYGFPGARTAKHRPHAPLWLSSHLRAQCFFSVLHTSRTFTSSWWFCLLPLHVFGKHQVPTVVFFCLLNARISWLGWTQMMMVSLTTKVPLSGQVCANPLCFLGGKLLLFLVDP